jgi:hypothetical protein
MAHTHYINDELKCAFVRYYDRFEKYEGFDALGDIVDNPLYQIGMDIIHNLSATSFPDNFGDGPIRKAGRERLAEYDRKTGICRIAWVVGSASDYAMGHRWVVSTRLTSEIERRVFRSIDEAKEWLRIPEDYAITHPA